MRRRREWPSLDDSPPEWVLRLDPERYRALAAEALERAPGDTWGAAMAAWRGFCREQHGWLQPRGINKWSEEWRHVFPTPPAPVGWVAEEFGTPCTDYRRTG